MMTLLGELVFLQAEDGIRDIGVTGVQTCALPIYPVRRRVRPEELRWVGRHALGRRDARRGARAPGWADLGATPTAGDERFVRSEERRVGKECRSWRSPYH